MTEIPFVKQDKHTLIQDGIDAWNKGDSAKATHLLVPQVESALRLILRTMGVLILQPSRHSGSDLVGMGHVLNSLVFAEHFPTDVRLHMIALYTDARGINLRHRLAHGTMRKEDGSPGMANWVIHSLILVALIKPKKGDSDVVQ